MLVVNPFCWFNRQASLPLTSSWSSLIYQPVVIPDLPNTSYLNNAMIIIISSTYGYYQAIDWTVNYQSDTILEEVLGFLMIYCLTYLCCRFVLYNFYMIFLPFYLFCLC